MTKMFITDYLVDHTLDELTENFGIIVTDYPDRVVLNYSQIDSPKYHIVSQECRALILHKPVPPWNTWGVLSRSFNRFFNFGEVPPERKENQEAILNDPATVITEKLDGSLCNVYHDGDKWQVATRKMAYAEGETARGNTFKQIFERALGCSIEERFQGNATNQTYIFELVSPETRIVHPYEHDDLYLLGVRCNDDGYEWSWNMVTDFATEHNFKAPKTYSLLSVDEILSAAKELPELDEGYVCRLDMPNGIVKRIKVKNPKYVAIAHLRNNGVVSDKRVVQLVMQKGYDEYLKYFPEDRPIFEPYIRAYGKMHETIRDLMVYMSIKDQKAFALKVKDTPVASIMFALRKGIILQEAIDKMTDNGKLRMMEALKDG